MTANVLAIAGASCSGKSTLFDSLQSTIGDQAAFVSFDHYFVGVDAVPDAQRQDWEAPDQTRYGDYCSDLENLKNGQAIRIRSKARDNILNGKEYVDIEPQSLVITEGYLVLWSLSARRHISRSIFIDIPESVMIDRRLRRSRSSDPWDSEDYIKNVLPLGYRKYILPQKEHADTIIDGTASPATVANHVLQIIKDNNLL